MSLAGRARSEKVRGSTPLRSTLWQSLQLFRVGGFGLFGARLTPILGRFALFLAVFSRFGRERQPCALDLTGALKPGLGRVVGMLGGAPHLRGLSRARPVRRRKFPSRMSLLAVAPSAPSPAPVVLLDYVDGPSGSPDLVLRAVSYLRVWTRGAGGACGVAGGFSIRRSGRRTGRPRTDLVPGC